MLMQMSVYIIDTNGAFGRINAQVFTFIDGKGKQFHGVFALLRRLPEGGKGGDPSPAA